MECGSGGDASVVHADCIGYEGKLHGSIEQVDFPKIAKSQDHFSSFSSLFGVRVSLNVMLGKYVSILVYEVESWLDVFVEITISKEHIS